MNYKTIDYPTYETAQELVRARTKKPFRFPDLLTALHGDDVAEAPAGSLVNIF